MHPILFTIPILGGLPVHTYGVLVATGFLVGMWWGAHDARRRGENVNQVMDLVFYMLLTGIVVSRLHYILVVDPGMFIRAPLDVFKIWQGGITFYGGLVGGIMAVIFFVWKKHISFWRYGDIMAPGVSIAHAFGRIGCLMAGCCHGLPTSATVWYGITFPADVGSLAPTGVSLYPTQIMESAGEILIFCYLVWRGRHQKFSGQIVMLYLMMYAALRFFLEYMRGDTDRGWWVEPYISTSQGIAIIMFVAGLSLYLWRRNYAK